MQVGNGQVIGAREVQEDYFAHFEINEFQVLIVADGIGGREQGEVASELAVRHAAGCLRDSDLANPAETLHIAVERANQAIQLEGNGSYSEGMGTTIVIALISDTRIIWISVGDSLLYRLRDGALQQLNTPHTHAVMLDQLVASGELTPEEAAADTERDSITSALMGVPIPLIDCREDERLRGDRFVVASDGILTVSSGEIYSVVDNAVDAQVAVDELLGKVSELALSYQDNCTLLVAMESGAKPARGGLVNGWVWAAAAVSVVALLAGIYYFGWSGDPAKQEPADNPPSEITVPQPELEVPEKESSGTTEPVTPVDKLPLDEKEPAQPGQDEMATSPQTVTNEVTLERVDPTEDEKAGQSSSSESSEPKEPQTSQQDTGEVPTSSEEKVVAPENPLEPQPAKESDSEARSEPGPEPGKDDAPAQGADGVEVDLSPLVPSADKFEQQTSKPNGDSDVVKDASPTEGMYP